MYRRARCYDCFRPLSACFCDSVPAIANRTEVLILQHRRERFHAFNTARIVRKSLANCRLLADYSANLATQLRLRPRAAVLYPGPSTTLLSELPPEDRPEQLVILDGTWNHAKTFIRDIPALQTLPRYRLAPVEPSNYRIRREPTAASLSTVEAVVAALRELEPETEGFDQLLRAFDRMIDDQLAHPGTANSERFRIRRSRTFKNIPLALVGYLDNIVVAYGEAAPGERGRKRAAEPPVSWLARRLGDGAEFSCTLQPPRPLDEAALRHLRLSAEDFARACTLDEARRRWAAFQRPTDQVVVFQPGTARLFAYLAGERQTCLVLKSIVLESLPEEPTLEGVLASQGIPVPPADQPGRGGERLAGAVAFVRFLNALARARLRSPVVAE